MLKFIFFSIISAFFMYNFKNFVSESWYAATMADMEDLVTTHGYPLEKHEATTEDGYILTIHRIPHGRNEPASRKNEYRPPVFLMHGLLCSSADWVILGPGKAIPLLLADAGYDVWMGNNRGNMFSRKHVTLHPDNDKKRFYDYSYHEIGIYDLPAMIDYVLQMTNFKKLTYIGYSEGFTSFVVMGSMRPEYNDKILLMNAYAPVTNVHNITSLVFNSLAISPSILEIAKTLRWYEMFPHTMAPVFKLLCTIRPLCRTVFYILGESKEQIQSQDFLLKVLSNFPAGMSLKQLTHYVQGTSTGAFAPFDYGKEKNLVVYGNYQPPSYDLTKITAPIILYYGDADNLIDNHDLINSVAKKLRKVVAAYKIPYPNFNHLDFLYGKDISLLTKEALRNINKYNNKSL